MAGGLPFNKNLLTIDMGLIAKLMKVIPTLKGKDTINKLSNCDVLLICQDVDRGDMKFGLPYSKLLDSMHEDLTSRDYLCKQFAPPFSLIVGKKAWAEPYSANRFFMTSHILGKFKNIINRDQILYIHPIGIKYYI